jgi:tetratricopeptide (TPR) repeat protein
MLDKELNMNPTNTFALNLKGSCLCELQLYNESMECYDLAFAIEPEDLKSWTNKGN